jgi:hypothetical protein
MAQYKSENGISFFGYLGLLFITLKLTYYIDWSWWWVLLPFYGGIAVIAVIFLFAFVLEKIMERWN